MDALCLAMSLNDKLAKRLVQPDGRLSRPPNQRWRRPGEAVLAWSGAMISAPQWGFLGGAGRLARNRR
jgi:hypothetical protein